MAENKISALGLLSGGLGSQIAVRVLQSHGITVRTIVFDNPFYNISAARQAAEALKVPLRVYDFTEDLIGLLDNPSHGFGKCMNPCIDCHALMLRRAGGLLEEEGCHFLFTGEVLNERPMSQTPRALKMVAADSTYADLILRPLSAQLMPATRPEREGWVDRSRLLALNGRRRTVQFALAKEYGITTYPSPAGGCLLTEPMFCIRLKELREHEGFSRRTEVERLRYGRHFRLSTGDKFILGRDADENATLAQLATEADFVLALADHNGPTGLLPVTAGDDALREAASIVAFYGKCSTDVAVRVVVKGCGVRDPLLSVHSMASERIDACRINS